MAVRKKTPAKAAKRRAVPPRPQDPVQRLRPGIAPPPVLDLFDQVIERLRRILPPLAEVRALPPGTVGPEVPVSRAEFQRLAVSIASAENGGVELWRDHRGELLVAAGKISVTLDEGLILVTIPVHSSETGDTGVQVAFAAGDRENPAGMLLAAEERTRGDERIADMWSEPLIAFAWKVVLTVTTELAARAGADADGASLIPVALTVGRDRVEVLTMARHTFDRVKRGKLVNTGSPREVTQ